MAEINVDAVVASVTAVTEFVDEQLEGMDCPMKAQIQIDVAIDEIFSNIAYYAYEGQAEPGRAVVRIEPLTGRDGISLTFIDSGMPYNPLEKADPDVTLALEDRDIGGLGIFMVKKTMTDMIYERVDEENHLTLIKEW